MDLRREVNEGVVVKNQDAHDRCMIILVEIKWIGYP
jgi:hypothetical protein